MASIFIRLIIFVAVKVPVSGLSIYLSGQNNMAQGLFYPIKGGDAINNTV
jgi:hypothetical protein